LLALKESRLLSQRKPFKYLQTTNPLRIFSVVYLGQVYWLVILFNISLFGGNTVEISRTKIVYQIEIYDKKTPNYHE